MNINIFLLLIYKKLPHINQIFSNRYIERESTFFLIIHREWKLCTEGAPCIIKLIG